MQKFTLAAVTLALMVLACEATLRALYPLPPTWLKTQTKHLHSPHLGWVLPPGSRSFVLDAPVSVNSLALRDDEVPREKPAGETRILCLGDSFTFALGIRFEDLYVHQLERRLAYRAVLDRGDNPFLPYGLHPSVVGMEIAADALYQVIRERGYLDFGKRGGS